MSAAASDQKKVFGLPHNVGIGFLCVLGALCLYAFYSNVLAGPSGVSAPPAATTRNTVASGAAAPPTIPMPGSVSGEETSRRPASTQRRNAEEFSPKLRSKRAEDRIDTSKVDPTLRLDLLAKVQAVEMAGGTRNLFQVGPQPPKAGELPKGPETIVRVPIGPAPPAPPKPAAAPPPEAPLQLKFYGFSTVVRNGKKTGFFMDGEDIVIAAEGEMVKRRYRVVHILATSVLVEDTERKRSVTIPITEDAPS